MPDEPEREAVCRCGWSEKYLGHWSTSIGGKRRSGGIWNEQVAYGDLPYCPGCAEPLVPEGTSWTRGVAHARTD